MSQAFDFIIIGGGTAGCVLAERLTADGRSRVALFEAGEKPKNPFVQIPAGFTKLFKSRCDWNFETTPQAGIDRTIYVPRGKMLGGCANMNAQIHQWGHPADFEGWEQQGAAGWGFDSVASHFRNMEKHAEACDGRGVNGAMSVETNAHVNPLAHAFVAAAHAAGLPRDADYNGRTYEGAWIAEIAHANGRRFSVYDAYLVPAMKRANLSVITNSHVRRILFEMQRAVGIEVSGDKGEHEFKAARGVILCAGAIGSPHLLLCSGIGPAETLRRHGISVVLDAPGVGDNLHDHPMVALNWAVRRRDTLKSAESPVNLLKYILGRKGPLASNAIEAIAFTNSGGVGVGPPDLEILFSPIEWRNQGLDAPSVHAFAMAIGVQDPKSRGRLTLTSSDSRTPPSIDYNLLGDADGRDKRILKAGVALARRIATTRPLADDVIAPIGPAAMSGDDDAMLDAVIAGSLQTIYHPAGTCRMGSDNQAVVSPELKAYGLDGLWIADASIMPALVRGHPNAAVAMIANRAANFIAAM